MASECVVHKKLWIFVVLPLLGILSFRNFWSDDSCRERVVCEKMRDKNFVAILSLYGIFVYSACVFFWRSHFTSLWYHKDSSSWWERFYIIRPEWSWENRSLIESVNVHLNLLKGNWRKRSSSYGETRTLKHDWQILISTSWSESFVFCSCLWCCGAATWICGFMFR